MEQLNTLHLIDVNDELLTFLKSKCTDGLQELTINYTVEQNKNLTRIINGWDEKMSYEEERNCTNLAVRQRTYMFSITYGATGMY